MLVSSGHPEYAPVFAEMHRQCFSSPWTVGEFESLLHLPGAIAWLVPEGFLLCSRVLDEMEILTIGVLPEHRRHHFASSLLTELMTYAKDNGISKIFLEVAIDNTPAQKLYASFGFTQTGRRKDYYQTATGPRDALCLTKIIA